MFKKTIITIFFSFFLISIAYHPVAYSRSIDKNINLLDIKNKALSISKTELLNFDLSIGKTLYLLGSVVIILLWLFKLVSIKPKIFYVFLLSLITARWQLNGHKNGFLPTNVTVPSMSDQMYTSVLLLFGILSLLIIFLNKGYSISLIALLFHIWLEVGFRNGIIDIDSYK